MIKHCLINKLQILLVITLVTLCSLIRYSTGIGSYDVEGVRELLAEQREELEGIIEQQNEAHQQQFKLQQEETEIQQKTIVELQATVHSLLKAVS